MKYEWIIFSRSSSISHNTKRLGVRDNIGVELKYRKDYPFPAIGRNRTSLRCSDMNVQRIYQISFYDMFTEHPKTKMIFDVGQMLVVDALPACFIRVYL